MDTFEFKPLSSQEVTPELTAMNTRVEFISGLEQVQENSSNPKDMWTLTFGGTAETLVALRNFWLAHKDGSPFYWTPPKPLDTQAVYRFGSNEFKPSTTYGIANDGTGFGIQKVTVQLTIRKVSDS